MADAYTLLGVTPEASEQDVRRAYRRLARTLHPDLQPEHLREESGRRLQAVNAARAQVLAEIRSRPAAAPRAASPGPVPQQRRSPDDAERLQRWVEHQEWLDLQREHAESWASGRASREQGRREQIRRDHTRRRRRARAGLGRAAVMVPAMVAVQAAAAWGVVVGVEHVVLSVATPQHSVARVPDDPDLRQVLALLASWRS